MIAAPGILIVKPLTDSPTGVVVAQDTESRIVYGEVLDVGPKLYTDFGAEIYSPCVEGDKIRFLSYEGNYDNFSVNGEKFYTVKFQDVRVIES